MEFCRRKCPNCQGATAKGHSVNTKNTLYHQQVMEIKKYIDMRVSDCEKDENQIKLDEQLKTKELRKRDRAGESLEAASAYLVENFADEWLVSGLALIESRLDDLLVYQKEFENGRGKEEKLQGVLEGKKELGQNSESVGRWKKSLNGVLCALGESRAELEKMLGGSGSVNIAQRRKLYFVRRPIWRELKNWRISARSLRMASPVRSAVRRSTPSRRMKYLNPPNSRKKITKLTEIIGGAKELEIEIESLKTRETKVRQDLTESEELKISIEKDMKSFQKNLVELNGRLEETKNKLSTLNTSILENLRPLGIAEITDFDAGSLAAFLQQRRREWLAALETKTGLRERSQESMAKLRGSMPYLKLELPC